MYASSALEARPADGEGLIDNELLPAPQPLPCLITINGTEIEARTGDSILAAARGAGISIPSMCADPRIKPSGGCGLCVVEIEGQAGPVKACATAVYEGVAIELKRRGLTNSAKRGLMTIWPITTPTAPRHAKRLAQLASISRATLP